MSRLGENHSGQLHLETAEQKPNRIIAQELARLSWTEKDLASRVKNDLNKLAIAVRVRKETTLTIKRARTFLHHRMQTHQQPQKVTSCAQTPVPTYGLTHGLRPFLSLDGAALPQHRVSGKVYANPLDKGCPTALN